MKAIGMKIKSIKRDKVGQIVIILEDKSTLTISHNIFEEPRVLYEQTYGNNYGPLRKLNDREYREEI